MISNINYSIVTIYKYFTLINIKNNLFRANDVIIN